MATPASSPTPLMLAASSPMSYFSYRGAGLEMADDEEESTFAPASSTAPTALSPASRLPSRLQRIQQSSSLPSFLNRQHVPLDTSTSYHVSQEWTRNEAKQGSTGVFDTIETIPHCDDDDNYQQSHAEVKSDGRRIGGAGEEKKQQSTDEAPHSSSVFDVHSLAKSSLRRDWPLINGKSSEVGVKIIIGSSDRRDGAPTQPQPPTHSNDDHRTRSSAHQQAGSAGILHDNNLTRDPIAVDDDDDDDDDDRDSNNNGPEKKDHIDHGVDYDDDFIKSFLDQAVDAPCQRFTVAPCMADLMDRQLDLFMRCRQPLEFLSLFRDDIGPDDEIERTLHGGGDGNYPLLHAVAPGAYVLPTFCEYCGSHSSRDCDPSRCQRPRLYFAKKRPPFANASTVHTFFDPVTDEVI